MNSGLYQITNMVNNKVYIGASADLRRRQWLHKSSLRSGSHYNNELQADWDEFGEGSFEFSVLAYLDPDRALLNYFEGTLVSQHGDLVYNRAFDLDWRSYMSAIHLGENNPNAKLTVGDVSKIRKLRANDGFSTYKLADMFNVGRTQIRRIINKEQWTHI